MTINCMLFWSSGRKPSLILWVFDAETFMAAPKTFQICFFWSWQIFLFLEMKTSPLELVQWECRHPTHPRSPVMGLTLKSWENHGICCYHPLIDNRHSQLLSRKILIFSRAHSKTHNYTKSAPQLFDAEILAKVAPNTWVLVILKSWIFWKLLKLKKGIVFSFGNLISTSASIQIWINWRWSQLFWLSWNFSVVSLRNPGKIVESCQQLCVCTRVFKGTPPGVKGLSWPSGFGRPCKFESKGVSGSLGWPPGMQAEFFNEPFKKRQHCTRPRKVPNLQKIQLMTKPWSFTRRNLHSIHF